MSIEADLRAALHERAAPICASSELLATDYHPRARRLRMPVVISGGLASIAAGVAACLLLLAGGASNAFAGWTPVPTAPTPAQVATAGAYCAKHMAFPGLPLKLVDTRGPFTFEIYANSTANDFCINSASFTNSSGFRTSPALTVPAGNLFVWSEQTATSAGQSYGYVIARAADDVRAVTLTLTDRTEVTATVQNGWAVAWWPGVHQVTKAHLTTSTGTQTQTLPPSTCGLHNCQGRPHGGAADGEPGGG